MNRLLRPCLRYGLRYGLWFALVAVVTASGVLAAIHTLKPLPDGLAVAMPPRAVTNAAFLADLTWTDADGRQRTEQQIFDEVLRLIGAAERLVVLDMFLFNDFAGSADGGHRALSRELTDALVTRKQARPGLDAILITDPFNTFYGGVESNFQQELRTAGIRVIDTDLEPLRDSNPLWSGWWRLCCRWAGNHSTSGWLPNPVGPGRVTLRSYLRVLNFKANHRKTLIADAGADWVGLVTSGNPHDASSRHGNVALRFSGAAALDLLETEWAVAAMSGAPDAFAMPPRADRERADAREPHTNGSTLRILTEAAVREQALDLIDGTADGDHLDIAMFYFSHRGLLAAVRQAAQRGAQIRVLLDPNHDAFGRSKSGVPNRQLGMELHEAGIPVRWCATRGEQCHGKMLLRRSDHGADLLLGSANFTRRNLDNYNLETNVLLSAPFTSSPIADALAFFERRWSNAPGELHSVAYPEYADHSRLRYWQYRAMEATGMSSF